MSRLLESIWRAISSRIKPVPEIVGDEIGSHIIIGKQGHQVPVESLNESRIGPVNNPHPTSNQRRATYEPWPGQGEHVDRSTSSRPTEDEALDNLEKQGY